MKKLTHYKTKEARFQRCLIFDNDQECFELLLLPSDDKDIAHMIWNSKDTFSFEVMYKYSG